MWFTFVLAHISDNLRTDYQFTFNLSKPDDNYYTGINFMNIPVAVCISINMYLQILCMVGSNTVISALFLFQI